MQITKTFPERDILHVVTYRKTIMRNYSGFYQDISGNYIYDIHELHCGINADKKNFFLLQFLNDYGVKRRPSKAKVLIWKFFPITHSIIYYNQKAKKSFLRHKSHWNSWGSSVIVFS